jgi:1-deoxy-D-xylulose-5-phosphate reductoisomerase
MGETTKSSKGITILGSTGSIGLNTLDVIRHHPDRFHVVALTANRDTAGLYTQCLEFRPAFAVLVDADSAESLRKRLEGMDLPTQVLSGCETLESMASLEEVDYVMAAIVGAAGLLPALAAARAGKRVLLANKEALVMSGQLFMKEIRDNRAELLPIDSEHNAIFQCMPREFERGLSKVGVERILLTASGGPFRNIPLEKLNNVTPEQACDHPNWVMGRKISVDSATMMNKGLEVIEACCLFDARPDQVEVVLHPQSVVHSLVAYSDGSVLAQLGNPDMRTPIAHALAWPERVFSGVEPLDLISVARLDFKSPDMSRFPCLGLAREALEEQGTATAILNAANEVAVQAFLEKRIAFLDIPRVISHTLEKLDSRSADSLSLVLAADQQARHIAREQISRLLTD